MVIAIIGFSLSRDGQSILLFLGQTLLPWQVRIDQEQGEREYHASPMVGEPQGSALRVS